jgi:hypothetical protein
MQKKDKFAMTHGSADFRALKSSNNNPVFFKDSNLNQSKSKPKHSHR